MALDAIAQTCRIRGWTLLAAHVRSSHFHVLLSARHDSGVVVRNLKKYASRDLRTAGLDGARKRRWTDGGSCRFLWGPRSVQAAADYVLNCQGDDMAVYEIAEWPFEFWVMDESD